MKAAGALDWDDTYQGLQFRIGYCPCGKKICVTPNEMEELVNQFHYVIKKKGWLVSKLTGLAKKLESPS